MTKAVFTTRIEPAYDDLPEVRYHFPKTYRRRVEEAVGDYVIYYEPGRSNAAGNVRRGRQSYFALARVARIKEDPKHAEHYYAFMDNYLDFDRPVPFRQGGHIYEQALRREGGGHNRGAFQNAVRRLPEEDFDMILKAGFAQQIDARMDRGEDDRLPGIAVAEEAAAFERPVIESVVARPFRDNVFRAKVRAVYKETCAMTGLKIINGGGRPEVQAAHIRPVTNDGPDSIRNGLALCSTAHWMFDRGLVSLENDGKILLSSKGLPEKAQHILNQSGYLNLPEDQADRPGREFLHYHRENVFKG